ncbi:MAG: YfiR/HmsC family protein [Flavobacteriales bacterium]
MKRNIFRFFFIIPLVFCGLALQAQSNVAARAQFIQDFTKGKYIEWPDKKNDFKVVIVGDSVLYAEVSKLTGKKGGLFKKNKVKVSLSSSIPDGSFISLGLVYVNSNYTARKMSSIIESYKGKPVLVVGENYPFHESMINFLTIDGALTFETNKALIEAQGLKALPELSSLSAQSEVQWNKLLAETEKRLQSEKNQAILNQQKVQKANEKIETLNQNLEENKRVLSSTSDTLLLTRDELEKRTQELVDKQAKLIQSKEVVARHKQLLIFMIIGAALGLIIIFVVYRNYVINKRAKIHLSEINKDLKKNKDELFFQKQLVDEKQKEITDSINYALRIQRSMLPPQSTFEKLLPDHFIFYRPKDIVSGDFYWIEQMNDLTLFGVIDCTGHGVPGALMSVVGMNILNQVVREKGVTDPSQILTELDRGIYHSLRQYSDDAAKDGMDLAICCWDSKKRELSFSGAFNPCWIVSGPNPDPVLNEVKGDMRSIGIAFGNANEVYKANTIKINKGDCVYLFSDGFPDQFGGPMGKKFKTSKLRELFTGMNNMSMKGQHDYIERTFEDWKKDYDQIDDVCVMGVRL